jgi:RimJ/RimL family protein N-acetyltransferase
VTPRLPTGQPLIGSHVRLDPFTAADVDEMAAILLDPPLYSAGYVIHRCPADADDARTLARSRCLNVDAPNGKGSGRVCYAIRLVADSHLGTAGTLVGTSSYGDVDLTRHSGHIGWTLYGTQWWGMEVNPEAKLLLLTEAFEVLGHGRVKIQTDVLNTRSQAAIAKLGAVREGVLRRETIREDGTWRDTVVFSVIVDEWPRVKAGLKARLSGRGPGPHA